MLAYFKIGKRISEKCKNIPTGFSFSDALSAIHLSNQRFLEYKKHYMSKYASAKNKIANYNKKLDEITMSYRESLLKEFERIQQYHFPDMDTLKTEAITKVDELKNIFDEYYGNHELLVAINDQYLIQDPIKSFVDSLSERILSPYSLEKIYDLCVIP